MLSTAHRERSPSIHLRRGDPTEPGLPSWKVPAMKCGCSAALELEISQLPAAGKAAVHVLFRPKTWLFFVSIKSQLLRSFQLSRDMNYTLKVLNPFYGSLTRKMF